MATVTGLTAARMLQIEEASIISGRVDGDELILRTQGGVETVAGRVRGPAGFAGPTGTSFWVTPTPLTEGLTSQVNPKPIAGQTIRVGDTILSTDPATVGYFATVTQVTSQTDVTVEYLGSLRGPEGEGVDGPISGPAVPGTMVWRADYNPNTAYTYGDVVRTTDGLFVALETVQGRAPALPMDPFADTFNQTAINSEWQINDGWVASNGSAFYNASGGLAKLVKTDLTPDGTFRVDGFHRQGLNDQGIVYFGWVDDLNHYRLHWGQTGNTTVRLQKVVAGVATTLDSTSEYFTRTAPTIVITKTGGELDIRAGARHLTALDPDPLNGTGWGFSYDAYGTSEALVDAVLFTPAESPSWGVIERRWALDSLTNVQVPSPNDGDILSFDESTGTWLAVEPPEGLTPEEFADAYNRQVVGFALTSIPSWENSVASGSAYAWKGVLLTASEDTRIKSVDTFMTLVIGGQYQGAIARVSGDDITEILAISEIHTNLSASGDLAPIGFPLTYDVAAGETICALVGRVDDVGTYALPVDAGGATGVTQGGYFTSGASFRVASPTLSVGTWNLTNSNPFRIGVTHVIEADLELPISGGGSASKLDELLDVHTSGVTDGQVLVYDAATQTWGPSDQVLGPDIIVSETEPANPEVGMIWVDISQEA